MVRSPHRRFLFGPVTTNSRSIGCNGDTIYDTHVHLWRDDGVHLMTPWPPAEPLQRRMATQKGLEPSTSGVTGRRSDQLNYCAVGGRRVWFSPTGWRFRLTPCEVSDMGSIGRGATSVWLRAGIFHSPTLGLFGRATAPLGLGPE